MTKARNLADNALTTVSPTELGYVDGVTSSIQTQLDAKIAKTLTTTTGDIIYASSANTPARLGIGSTGQALTVSGGVPAWGTISTAANFTLLNAGGTSLSGTDTVVSGLSGYNSFIIYVKDAAAGSSNWGLRLRMNNDSTSGNHVYHGIGVNQNATPYALNRNVPSDTVFAMAWSTTTTAVTGLAYITGCNSSGFKYAIVTGNGSGDNSSQSNAYHGFYKGSSVISSIAINNNNYSWSQGTVYVYGSVA